MELKLGKMTRQEIAAWFGVQPRTYDNSKRKKLEELKKFADFEEVYGGVNIIKIKIPVYARKGSEAYQIIKDNFDQAWHKSGLDTAARVGSQIWIENPQIQDMISETTARQYACRIRKEFYGLVYKQNSEGTKGICHSKWVAENNWDEAVLLSKEQEKQLKQTIKDIYANENEPLLYTALRNHEITEQEYQEALDEWNSTEARQNRYEKFKASLIKIFGFMPEKVTELIKGLNFGIDK